MTVFESLFVAVARLGGAPASSRRQLKKRHAHKAYDIPRARRALRTLNVQSRIARRGVDLSARVGLLCPIVERTWTRITRLRRLSTSFESRKHLHDAFFILSRSL